MTPENRAQMQSVLRESLRKAYLPGSTPAHAAPHGHPHEDASVHTPLPPVGGTDGGTPLLPAGGTSEAAPLLTRRGTSGHAPLPLSPEVPGERGPGGEGFDQRIPAAADALVERFCQELEALAGATYRAANTETVADQLAQLLARFETKQLLSWSMEAIGLPGLADALAARGIELLPTHLPFADPDRKTRLDLLAAATVGLTGADAALATSGSLVLVSGPGRGRLSSLLTPIHIAILHRDRILPSLPDLFRLRPELATQGSNMVIVTGPSRTADIEMTLSRGVHGPREVHVIVV